MSNSTKFLSNSTENSLKTIKLSMVRSINTPSR